ncbi:MAG: ATP synthase F1 subunit delta [bacterium]
MKPSDRILAKRYARAYLEGAGSAANAEARLACLEECRALMAPVMDFMSHPLVPWAEKSAVIRQALRQGEGGGAQSSVPWAAAANLLDVFFRGKRFGLLPAILEENRTLMDEMSGVVRVHIDSAFAVSAAHAGRLKKGLDRMTGKNTVLETAADPALMGGLRIKLGDFVMDSSIKSRLERLGKEISLR